MAIKKTNNQESKTENVIDILKVKDISNRKDCYRFTMKINGVTIYGCQYITFTDRDGNEKNFISFPQYKGNDGKYYNHCWIELSDSDVQRIEALIGGMINE